MGDLRLRRITRAEVPLASRWQFGAVWDLEVAQVKNWLDERAADNLGKAGATVESALQDGSHLSKEINLTYGAQAVARDQRVVTAAANGLLEREAPARTAVIATDVLKWLFFLSELCIFGWMVWMGLSTGIVILVGLLLAGAGLLLGDGAGRLLVRHEQERDWSDSRGWLEFVVGLAGVTAISYIRTVGEEEGVFTIVAITAFLAVLIATFHAMHKVLIEKYTEQHQKMFAAQGWFATDEHLRAYQAGFWKDYYERQVKALATQLAKVDVEYSNIAIARPADQVTSVADGNVDRAGEQRHEPAN